MARLCELIIVARDPSRLANFYRQVFELSVVLQCDQEIVLSDGRLNLILRKNTGGQNPGLRAASFWVHDLAALRKQLGNKPQDSSNSRERFADPDGNLIEINEGEFKTAAKSSPFPIRHMALYTADPRRLADFYGEFLKMKEVAASDRSSIFVSDGYFNLALLFERPGEEKNGLNHFGFHVRDIEEMRDRADRAGVPRGEKRPDRIPFAEYRLHDPEGNGIDISVKGWQV
jgi:catechol-2,3-dioxygenase